MRIDQFLDQPGVETVTVTTDDALAYFDKCDLFWLHTRELVACGKTLAEEVRSLRLERESLIATVNLHLKAAAERATR